MPLLSQLCDAAQNAASYGGSRIGRSAAAAAAPVVAWAGLRGRLETGRWKAAVRCKS